ncbi:MAG: hypothetical protein IPL32_17670 [Chloracidobacterium sp.]|nr:hypothetical protein [Chloracidobacterium sp.]
MTIENVKLSDLGIALILSEQEYRALQLQERRWRERRREADDMLNQIHNQQDQVLKNIIAIKEQI